MKRNSKVKSFYSDVKFLVDKSRQCGGYTITMVKQRIHPSLKIRANRAIPAKRQSRPETKMLTSNQDTHPAESLEKKKNSNKTKADVASLKGQVVIARDSEDGIYYEGVVITCPSTECAKVKRSIDEKISEVNTRFLLPVKGAVCNPPLRVGDYVLVRVMNMMCSNDCYIPGIVQVASRNVSCPYFSILLYNDQTIATMRRHIVKISKERFDFTVEYICQILEVESKTYCDEKRSSGAESYGFERKIKKKKNPLKEERCIQRKTAGDEIQELHKEDIQKETCIIGERKHLKKINLKNEKVGRVEREYQVIDENNEEFVGQGTGTAEMLYVHKKEKTERIRAEEKDSNETSEGESVQSSDASNLCTSSAQACNIQARLLKHEDKLRQLQSKLQQHHDQLKEKQEEDGQRICVGKITKKNQQMGRTEHMDKETFRTLGLLEMRKALLEVKEKEEVVARWSDGWYHRGIIKLSCQDFSYMVMDSTGNMEKIWREDIVTERDDVIQNLLRNDKVIALHPDHSSSYAPAVVTAIYQDSNLQVRFYDHVTSELPRQEAYKIPEVKYFHDVKELQKRENQWKQQVVVARDDKTGKYSIGYMMGKNGDIGLNLYKVLWLDGTTVLQCRQHIFGAFTKRHKLAVGDRILAVRNRKTLDYLPGWVVGDTGGKLRVKFCDESLSDDIKPNESYWLSQEYFDQAVHYLNS